VKVALGKFARSSIEELLGGDLHDGVEAALTHYTHRLNSNLKPVRPPDFDWVSVDSGDIFDLTVAPELEAALEQEALEQRVPLDQILVHAVLVYLADLESVSFSGDLATPPTEAARSTTRPAISGQPGAGRLN
jgi:hypothetical protein